jgi:DNA polymerase-3 subunit delta'
MEHPDVEYIIPVFSKSKDEEIYEKKKKKIQNPYQRIMFEGNTSISIDTIRNLKNSSIFKPFEGKKKITIISNAEKMTIQAANSILKLLEEPPKDMLFILTTEDQRLILPTIQSRCTGIKFLPLQSEEIKNALLNNFKIDENDAEIISIISEGNYTTAAEFLQEGIKEISEFAEKFIEIVSSNNSHLYLDFAEVLSKKRDLSFVKDFLSIFNQWVKEAIHLIIKSEKQKELEIGTFGNKPINQLMECFSCDELELIKSEIENSIDLINKNIYINLILINLSINIKRILKKAYK